MRYREFSINIPINIRFGDNGEIDIETDEKDIEDKEIMVPPLQQKLELAKAGLGKQSRVANELLQDDFLDENNSNQE
jgi:hypothetical protein